LTLSRKPTSAQYARLAKVLNDHYRQAVWPTDANEAPYVYWLAGPNRTPRHSYIASREEFNKHYLDQFGPLFDVAEWLNEYRRWPEEAVRQLIQKRAAAAQQADGADQASKRKAGGDRRSEAYRTKVDTQQNDVNLDQPDGNSRATALRRLRKDRLDLHARVMNGELSAHAAMIETGFRKRHQRPKLTPVARALRAFYRLSVEERALFRAEIQ